MANMAFEGVFEEEAFDASFCPPLPIAALSNLTNLVARTQEARKPVSVQVRQDGKRHYAVLKQMAEEYAVLKKQGELDAQGAEAGLWQLCRRSCLGLCQHGAAVKAPQQGTATEALQGVVRSFVPEEDGPLSIGSIPHAAGEPCAAGACRFHKKGKCFDGLLCRFCHCGGDHTKPAKPRAQPKGRQPVDVSALQALFAALDSAAPVPPRARMPVASTWRCA